MNVCLLFVTVKEPQYFISINMSHAWRPPSHSFFWCVSLSCISRGWQLCVYTHVPFLMVDRSNLRKLDRSAGVMWIYKYLARKDGFVLPTIHTCGDSQSGRSTRLMIVWSKLLILQPNTFILASFLGLLRLQHLITCSWSKTEAREGLKSGKWKQG